MKGTVVRVALACTLLLSPVGAAVATADHTSVEGAIHVIRNDTVIATYRNGPFTCAATLCAADVAVRGRDLGRFMRWCGIEVVDVTIPAGQSVGTSDCFGPGTWRIAVEGNLRGATHSVDVVVRVHAVPMP